MTTTFFRILVTGASLMQIGFGVWHFFVPRLWDWYRYMDPAASELVLAVRAINFFFSLCLVLMGIQNLLFVFREPRGSYALRVALGTATLLWLARSAMQLVFPQGSTSLWLQYGMLVCFICVTLAFALAFWDSLRRRNVAEAFAHSDDDFGRALGYNTYK